MTPILVDVRGLTVQFRTGRGTVRAVNDVSWQLREGEILGIVGESGSGKSVTARAVMGMLRSPGRVDSGVVELGGRDLLGLDELQLCEVRGRDMAMVFQDPQAALNPVMRVGEQIAEALLVHGASRSAARARALELLAQVGIPDVERTADLYPHEFSGGMRQRVVIAIALANKPRLLIADEPTTALDVTIQAQILELLVELRRELGIAIVMITHDMGVVAELCDRMLVMYGGRVVESGPVADVFAAPRHPYTHALLGAVPRADAGSDALPAIPGSPPDPARLPTGCAFHPRCAVAEPQCATTRPELTTRDGDRTAACWVSERGDTVTVLPTPTVRTRRPGTDPRPILQVTDLVTDVGSRSRGLFGRTPPVHAVNGVSLEVAAGETLGLVGESGCGKSTLSRTIVGINRPASGRIVVDGTDVTAMDRRASGTVTSTIQYVFQDPYASLNPRRTVGQSLTEALGIAGVTGRTARTRSAELLDRVGLHRGHLDRYPQAFSGGQRQRVGIARALAAEPRMLICDEPVSALDVSIQAQIINLLEDLRNDLGLGYLFIAHDLGVVRHLSDRVAVMYLGRIVETGPAEDVYRAPQHPYTRALLSSTPEPDTAARGRERIVLTGDMPSPAHPPSGCTFRTRCPIGPLHRSGREICEQQRPDLAPTPAGQLAACHFPGEL
ncbi:MULTISPECIES: ABC transporter ATP-binding protein [Pseudonocardia]|uniref:Peptide/nickel transport system ATP-binding protein n=1 Tax=Pseudonocardia alni TaxID=33907 RepID=A0A852W5J7_PSEA5|nr:MULTISPECIES: ABC transporter ATP-binding protein [Pseudonocardia]MCO7193531.1 ABC transporter ATP-binding protein [Pseudonocardia sp. McavD-2-B]NYG04388.1 peptide/nickel transport system ATP-binding protein [Pseudonocardia antarctica]